MRSFRLVCHEQHMPLVEALLRAEGFRFEPEPFSRWCRKLTAEPMPLGASIAATFGCIYIQDRSSMLPPLALLDALAPSGDGDRVCVLDMCASPGSKTGFLAQLVGSQGFILGNEPSKNRLATLRANMHNLGFLHVATCSYEGEKLPLLPNSWQHIQLDPPCSGWGTEEKNPHVRTLWHGEKVQPLIHIQRTLLKKAWELLAPGGTVVYSTCTTNVEENEQQVHYALDSLGFELIPLRPFDGFVWEQPHMGMDGTLRVDGARSSAQGFYIAALRKAYANTSAHEHAQAAPVPTALFSPHSGGIVDHVSSLFDTSHCVDVQALTEGHVMAFGKAARFVPHLACTLIPQSMQWQAALLGKYTDGGKHAHENIRLSARCKILMPHVAPQHALVLERIEDIHKLLQGQNVLTGLNGRETGLYFGTQHGMEQGTLPLGRVTLKKGRALLA